DVDLTVDLADDFTTLRKSATVVGSPPLQLLQGTLGRFTLAAGTTATYSFTARVNTGLASGTHVRNTVTGSATYDDGGTTRQIQSTCQSSTWDKSPVECRTDAHHWEQAGAGGLEVL
ncbi:hypothetical protein JS562_52145, partial [Agrobacterium sp. S2]|nr:hypothetical protein [Agrobacterium sp. S2]